MKNKGFTLVELVACIALMGILATILISSSVKKMNEVKEKSRATMIKSIEMAAVEYINENIDRLNDFRQNDCMYITLQELVNSNKLSSNLLDQTINNNLPLTDEVYITRAYNGKISSKYDIDQNTKSKLKLNGSFNIYLSLNDTYTELGVTATSITGANISSDVKTLGTINVPTKGIYVIKYSLSDIEITRNVIVQ